VAKINAGLEEAPIGIIVFSEHSRESRWVEAEVSYLTYARIQDGKVLIPVVVGAGAWVPPLLRPLAWRDIEEVEAIADAVLGRKPGPPPIVAAERGRVERVLISLTADGATGQVRVQVRIGGQVHGSTEPGPLPPGLQSAHADFLRGFSAGHRRSPDEGQRASLESIVADLGRQLRSLCLAGDAGEAVANLLDGCPVGHLVEVCIEADGAELLELEDEDGRAVPTTP